MQTKTKLVFRALRAKKLQTTAEVAARCGIDAMTVSKLLANLVARDAVTVVKVEGARAMYMANKNVKFNAAKKPTVKARKVVIRKTVEQLQKELAAVTTKLTKLMEAM